MESKVWSWLKLAAARRKTLLSVEAAGVAEEHDHCYFCSIIFCLKKNPSINKPSNKQTTYSRTPTLHLKQMGKKERIEGQGKYETIILIKTS